MLGKSSKEKFEKEIKNISKKNITENILIDNCKVEILIKGVRVGRYGNENIILDKEILEKRIEKISRELKMNKSKYVPIPSKVVLDMGEEDKKNTREEESFEVHVPTWSLKDIYVPKENKEKIKMTLSIVKNKKILFDEWGVKGNRECGRAICFNFFGAPGTGKSIVAEGIASELGKKILKVNYSELESKYVGETPKNIKKVFKKGKELNAVIIFDEADSFLSKRLTNITQATDYGINLTRSVMLMELENFDGIVIFTTNLLKNYDEAFKRRILANIEFKLPNKEGRRIIWDSHLSDKLPVSKAVNSEILSEKIEGISGADIKDIVLFAAVRAIENKQLKIELMDFIKASELVKARYCNKIEVKTERISEEEYAKGV